MSKGMSKKRFKKCVRYLRKHGKGLQWITVIDDGKSTYNSWYYEQSGMIKALARKYRKVVLKNSDKGDKE